MSIWGEFWDKTTNFSNYVWSEVTFQTDPPYINYFYFLIAISLLVWVLEIAFPWRKDQSIFRKDFWKDAFYMFFNFYVFKIIFFAGFSGITYLFFNNITNIETHQFGIFNLTTLPVWSQLLIFFIVMDFVQWLVHRLLHRFDFLWQFHKLHHSVEEMGFAAHLRYHWVETLVYEPAKYLALTFVLGVTPEVVFLIYYITIAIGHINHANIGISYGPLKYIFNNPKMHIWHHVRVLPKNRMYGVNFGISLSCWDYIFRTSYIPSDGKDLDIGIQDSESFPDNIASQLVYPLSKKS